MLPGSVNTMTHQINKPYVKFLYACLLTVFLLFTVRPLQAQPVLSKPSSFLNAGEWQVTIGYFNQREIPDSLSGCAETYAFDTTAFRLHQLVLFFDKRSTLLLKIDGRLLYFHIDKAEEKNKTTITDFSGNGYTGRLISKAVKQLDITYWVYSATLELRKNGKKKILNLLGYYSC